MKRQWKAAFLFLCLLCTMCGTLLGATSKASMIFSHELAGRLGLVQAWYNQVSLDTKVDSVTDVVLADKQLFVTTSASMLQVFNAETGTEMWSRRVGPEKYHTYCPAANSRVVVVVNGTTLYVYDRFNGKNLLTLPLYSEPVAGPQVSEHFIYIPLLSQKMYAVPLVPLVQQGSHLASSLKQMAEVRKTVKFSPEIEKKMEQIAKEGEQTQYLLQPVEDSDICFCPTFGFSLVPPTLATQHVDNDYVTWTTTEGKLMIGRAKIESFQNKLELLYKIVIKPQTLYLDSNRYGNRQANEANDVQAAPHFIPADITDLNMMIPQEKRQGGLIFIGNQLGNVLAVNDMSGDVRWKFLTGSAVVEKISSFDNFCYISTLDDTLFCVDIKNGQEVWKASSVQKVLSLSKNSIYAVNAYGHLVLLNRANGKQLGSIPMGKYKYKYLNDESDRIYLITEDGLIQCLREQNRVQPEIRKELSMEIAARLEKEVQEMEGPDAVKPKVPAIPELDGAQATVMEGIQEDPKADTAKPAATPAEPSQEEKAAAPSSPDDIFGEATGEKPKKEPEKKKDDTAEDPFGNIFE